MKSGFSFSVSSGIQLAVFMPSATLLFIISYKVIVTSSTVSKLKKSYLPLLQQQVHTLFPSCLAKVCSNRNISYASILIIKFKPILAEWLILLNKTQMSFLSKIGQDLQKDKKLVILRKRYFHDILQFNQNSEQKQKDNILKQKYQANSKVVQMNTEALKAQQSEKVFKLHQKVLSQMALKSEYDKQIKQKREMKKNEKEIDKKYVKLQQIQTDKAADRRLQDLMKIYERVGSGSTHRRVKTQALKDLQNPEKSRRDLVLSRRHLAPLGYLPPIEISKKSEGQHKQGLDQSLNEGKSERVVAKRGLF